MELDYKGTHFQGLCDVVKQCLQKRTDIDTDHRPKHSQTRQDFVYSDPQQ